MTKRFLPLIIFAILANAFSSANAAVLVCPVANLGNDTTLCADSLMLNAFFPGTASYLWNTGDTAASLSVTASGTYTVLLTDSFGCTDRDTIVVTLHAPANAVIDPSGLYYICPNTGEALYGNFGNFDFLWSTGDTTQSIMVYAAGDYILTITDTNGCSDSDTATVALLPVPVLDLGNDTLVCSGNVVLDTGQPGQTYYWSTGAQTQTISVSTGGIYWAMLTNPDGCSDTDSVVVTINPLAGFSLGADQQICGDNYMLGSPVNAAAYLWSTSGTSATVIVNTSGSYWLQITDTNGCTAADTVQIVFLPPPPVELGPNIQQCQGPVLLDAGAASSYIWSSGQTSQVIQVTASGQYSVTVTNANGCTASDMVQVTITLPPVTFGLPEYRDTLCLDASPFIIGGGMPLGGVYGGPGISGPVFTAGDAGLGTHALRYIYTSGACSDTAYATIFIENCFTGLSSGEGAGMEAFPNPTAGMVMLELPPAMENGLLTVLDLQGNTVLSRRVSDAVQQLDLSLLAPGVYVLKLSYSQRDIYRRIVRL